MPLWGCDLPFAFQSCCIPTYRLMVPFHHSHYPNPNYSYLLWVSGFGLRLVHIWELLRNGTFSDNCLGKETYVKFIMHPGVVNVLHCVCTSPAVRLWYNENFLLKCVWLGRFFGLVVVCCPWVKLFSLLPATEKHRVPGNLFKLITVVT